MNRAEEKKSDPAICGIADNLVRRRNKLMGYISTKKHSKLKDNNSNSYKFNL